MKHSSTIDLATRQLFKAGFSETEYDGKTLDINLSSATLNGSYDAHYFKQVLPSVARIVDVL